ncbi:MAG: ArsR/SmtB family transcription factor [Luteibaculaceae bacterium]
MEKDTLTASPVVSEESIAAANYAKALSHPIRIEILKLLSNAGCCFNGDLTHIFPLAQSTISQHLKALKTAGLIQGEIMPPKIKYCINRENFNHAKTLFSTFFNEQ